MVLKTEICDLKINKEELKQSDSLILEIIFCFAVQICQV